MKNTETVWRRVPGFWAWLRKMLGQGELIERREAPRMGWANAHRIQDDHAGEVSRIETEAFQAAARR